MPPSASHCHRDPFSVGRTRDPRKEQHVAIANEDDLASAVLDRHPAKPGAAAGRLVFEDDGFAARHRVGEQAQLELPGNAGIERKHLEPGGGGRLPDVDLL